jgi:hypothetical protein
MSIKYKNIRVAVIYEDSKVSLSFVDTLKEAEFRLVLQDRLQTELLTWLVSRHTTLYQGKEGEFVYRGTMTPIEGNKRQAASDLIHTLRNEQPVLDNLEDIRKIVLDLAQEAERLEYIFCTHQPEFIQNRFGWIQDALIEDIQSYIDGTQAILDGTITTGHPPAGGNLSIPILVCTGLELVSALYLGMTRYLDEKNYRAEDNVAKFIDSFFPEHLKSIPRILWDGVRNGIDHLFVPKSMQCAQNKIRFNFRREEQNSDVFRVQDIIVISINVITFHRALRQAIADYKNKLQNDDELQRKFINAWSSIEEYHRNITNDNRKINELNHLIKELDRNGRVDLFQRRNQ